MIKTRFVPGFNSMDVNGVLIGYNVLLTLTQEISEQLGLTQEQYEKLHKLLLSESGK